MSSTAPQTDADGQSLALLSRERSAVFIIDMQEKLRPAIPAFDMIANRIEKLVEAARLFHVPVLASEHCPQSLGQTVGALRTKLHENEIVGKNRFSAWPAICASDALAETLQRRDQIIVAGVEAHVCVLQTCLDAVGHRKSTYLTVDAVGSRRALDAQTAATRLRGSGVTPITSEMAVMEWTRSAADAQFKAALSVIK